MIRVFGGAALIVAGIAAFTDYDLLHIGACASFVFGVLLVVVGLIGYARRPSA